MISSTTKSVVLIILDGLGLSATAEGNPLFSTPLPHLSNLLTNFPAFSLMAAGQAVGLPWGEQGNSEVGHLNIGTGRIVEQDLPRISRSITEGAFFQNPALLWLLDTVVKKKSALHLFGLLSTGGVHSHLDHLLALLKLCRQQKFSNKVYLHLILDGRDAPPKSALKYQEKIPASAQIATIMGRFYAMDRDKRWERTQASYDALVNGAGEKAK
ncbi:2,3-bisphosphoglycerate-independent phosphoglycerate mutase, partial [Candidatus Berkelbacteria bacterium]|nr:2,3-bisphosphoglycerate-independent phosphoglycerate mutase [Candidatus Berkelbacteria bacterium]